MKKIVSLLVIAIVTLAFFHVNGQTVNGKPFSFPKGKTEWSDTIYKKLLTKEMADKGTTAVLIAIRYKFVKSVPEGNIYQIEITNKSKETKIKFKVISNKSQDKFTVELDPLQTKVLEKLYWKSSMVNAQGLPDPEGEYINPLLDELNSQERY